MNNADEIAKALRCHQTKKDKPCLSCLIEQQKFCDTRHDDDAADLIENLQSQLAASQRRERAAVTPVDKVWKAVEAAFSATDYVKPNTGIWHALGLALDWIKAWRGPQEARKESCE